MNRNSCVVVAVALSAALAAAAGCGREAPARTEPTVGAGTPRRPLRVAMSAAFVSEKGVPVYDDIATYLEARFGGSPKMVAAMRDKLREVLLAMHESPEGRSILDRALIDKFVDPGDGTYDSIRQAYAAAKQNDYMTIR